MKSLACICDAFPAPGSVRRTFHSVQQGTRERRIAERKVDREKRRQQEIELFRERDLLSEDGG